MDINNRLKTVKTIVVLHSRYYEFQPGDKVIFAHQQPSKEGTDYFGNWELPEDENPDVFTVKSFIPPEYAFDRDDVRIDNLFDLDHAEDMYGTVVLEEFPDLEITDIPYNMYPAGLTLDQQDDFDNLLDSYRDSVAKNNTLLSELI